MSTYAHSLFSYQRAVLGHQTCGGASSGQHHDQGCVHLNKTVVISICMQGGGFLNHNPPDRIPKAAGLSLISTTLTDLEEHALGCGGQVSAGFLYS
jgi:hypothetical protein